MKKLNHYVLNGAIALLSTAGLVACSSSDEIADAPVNPTYDGKSVKTAFAINVAAPSKGGTRMTGSDTQQGDSWSYLKMSNIYLMALGETPADASAINLLTNLADPTSVNDTRSSHIYKNISIPVGTSDFLFYATRGEAANSSSSVDDKFKKGVINSSLYNTNNTPISKPSEINFSLEKVVADLATFNSRGTDIVSYLNSVASVAGWSSTTDAVLKDAFDTFTATATNRSCSSFGLRRMMSDLYNVVSARKSATGLSSDIQTLADNIISAIKNTSGDNIHFVVAASPSDGCTLEYSSSTGYDKFPADFNLPEGAAQYSCTHGGTNPFVFTNSATVGQTNTVDVANVSYPACIAYYVNTPAKASDKEMQDNEWKTTTSAWNTAFDVASVWYNAVTPATRSIALKNNINYGVACLATTVKCANVILKDNAKVVASASADNDVNIGTGFEVTGILIGGQPGQVGWQYVNTTADGRNAVVYDKSLTSITANTTGSSTNYTLLFDNYKGGGTQENVNVAIELVNDKQDFYGVNGIIPKGQKFYLVGQLTLSSPGNISGSVTTPKWPKYGTEADNLPTSYQGRYPAMAGTAGEAINRVFVQDYTTTANFTIKDLKKAYVTIPDLRASQLQLGLSVDLTWQTGLTFNVDL